MTGLIVFVALMAAGGLVIGFTVGDWWGERRVLRDQREAAEARRARAWLRQVRAAELPADEPVLYGRRRPRDARQDPDLIGKILRPSEVAPEWEPVHAGQALALVRPDLTDSAYTQDMGDRMTRFLEELLRVPYSADELWSGQ